MRAIRSANTRDKFHSKCTQWVQATVSANSCQMHLIVSACMECTHQVRRALIKVLLVSTLYPTYFNVFPFRPAQDLNWNSPKATSCRYIILCFKIRPLLHVFLNNCVARPSFKNLKGIFFLPNGQGWQKWKFRLHFFLSVLTEYVREGFDFSIIWHMILVSDNLKWNQIMPLKGK